MDQGEQTADGLTTPVEVTIEVQQREELTVSADLSKVRELVLKAHPDVVPDLVQGASVDELIASVEPARSAWQRVVQESRSREAEEIVAAGRRRDERDDSSTSSVVQPPAVPAGGAVNVLDPTELTPMTKIARALAERRKRGS